MKNVKIKVAVLCSYLTLILSGCNYELRNYTTEAISQLQEINVIDGKAYHMATIEPIDGYTDTFIYGEGSPEYCICINSISVREFSIDIYVNFDYKVFRKNYSVDLTDAECIFSGTASVGELTITQK